MKLDRIEKIKMPKRRKLIYISIILICILAIAIAVYSQFFTDANLGAIIGITKKEEDEEKIELLKAEFDNIFDNTLHIKGDIQLQDKKIDETKDIVYTGYTITENSANNYDLQVNIPYINIENETIKEYNKSIQDFEAKAKNVLETTNRNTVYQVEYTASIHDNILSVIVRANLKDVSSAQRILVQTYNFNLETNQEVSLEEMIQRKGINKNYVQNQINEEIAFKKKQAEELKSLGYNVYTRNETDIMYKLENTNEFYYSNEDYIYVIYAYGNDNFTSEMDLIII